MLNNNKIAWGKLFEYMPILILIGMMVIVFSLPFASLFQAAIADDELSNEDIEYQNRLIVISDGNNVGTRPGDNVIGEWDNTLLIGFDSMDELETAKQYYDAVFDIAAIDGEFQVASDEISIPDADDASSTTTYSSVAVGEDALTIAAEIASTPPPQ